MSTFIASLLAVAVTEDTLKKREFTKELPDVSPVPTLWSRRLNIPVDVLKLSIYLYLRIRDVSTQEIKSRQLFEVRTTCFDQSFKTVLALLNIVWQTDDGLWSLYQCSRKNFISIQLFDISPIWFQRIIVFYLHRGDNISRRTWDICSFLSRYTDDTVRKRAHEKFVPQSVWGWRRSWHSILEFSTILSISETRNLILLIFSVFLSSNMNEAFAQNEFLICQWNKIGSRFEDRPPLFLNNRVWHIVALNKNVFDRKVFKTCSVTL